MQKADAALRQSMGEPALPEDDLSHNPLFKVRPSHGLSPTRLTEY